MNCQLNNNYTGNFMKNKIIIIGAGVDKTKGIEMPLANELITELIKFSENEGKIISDLIKRQIQNFRFTFKHFLNKEVDIILNSEWKTDDENLYNLIKDIDKVQGTERTRLFLHMLKKLNNIKRENYIDDDVIKDLNEFFNDKLHYEISDEWVIDLRQIGFSDGFKQFFKLILQESINLKKRSGLEGDEELYNLILSHYFDFESILVESFIGFYTQKSADIKKYLYISWMLWAYFCYKETLIEFSDDNIPFYSKIPKNWNMITFNYTSFAARINKNTLYFHGSLKEYIRLDNRNIINTNYLNFKDIQSIKLFLEHNIKQNFEEKIFFIPSIIPPLKIKPVIATKFLEVWSKSRYLIKNSEEIVIVGYSFAAADEHINDILREFKHKKITIIGPYIEKLMGILENIYSKGPKYYSSISIQDKEAFICDNVTLIKSYADEINYNKI